MLFDRRQRKCGRQTLCYGDAVVPQCSRPPPSTRIATFIVVLICYSRFRDPVCSLVPSRTAIGRPAGMSVCMSVCMHAYLCLCVCAYVCVSVCLPANVSVCMSICLAVCLLPFYLYICLSEFQSLSVYLLLRLAAV